MSLEDVARRARVSTATVSRVLNNVSGVEAGTRSRVLKAIEDLKYSPNPHARALAGGASRALGLIVSNLENPFSSTSFALWNRRRTPMVTRFWWPIPTTIRSG